MNENFWRDGVWASTYGETEWHVYIFYELRKSYVFGNVYFYGSDHDTNNHNADIRRLKAVQLMVSHIDNGNISKRQVLSTILQFTFFFLDWLNRRWNRHPVSFGAWGTLVSLHLEWHCGWLVYSVREYSPLKGIWHYREEGMIEWERNLSTQSSPPCQPDSWEGGIKCKYPRGHLYPKPLSD